MKSFKREFWFLSRDRVAVLWLILAIICASASIYFGMQEISSQQATIERLKAADIVERNISNRDHRDWGSAAYYTFHLTYDAPSEFAFAAIGQRDVQPWKHRVRMLALEGQIYEADAKNPDFALIGRFDYAFVIAVLLPLFVIFLLYDLRARERANGRFELLDSMSNSLWRTRAALRLSLLILMFLLPLWFVSFTQGVSAGTVALASLIVVIYSLFWWAIIGSLAYRDRSNTFNLAVLIGIWFAFTVVVPAGLKVAIDKSIAVPDSGDLLLTQREAVNDAWDLPVEDTMQPFLQRHPQWANYTAMQSTFEWKWYYAFQQVGDQVVEPISQAYRSGRERRDNLSAMLSWLSPPAKVERTFQFIANTNLNTHLKYEDSIRQFHHDLRQYYYPKLFKGETFSNEALAKRPDYLTIATESD